MSRRTRYLRAVGIGLVIAYIAQATLALAVGYDFAQALTPSEALRVRARMDASDPWARDIAARAHSPEEAEALVMAAIKYDLSLNVWGKEQIPTLAQMRDLAERSGWAQLHGDCKSQAVALGSVWRAMGVRFAVHHTYEHVWLTKL